MNKDDQSYSGLLATVDLFNKGKICFSTASKIRESGLRIISVLA